MKKRGRDCEHRQASYLIGYNDGYAGVRERSRLPCNCHVCRAAYDIGLVSGKETWKIEKKLRETGHY